MTTLASNNGNAKNIFEQADELIAKTVQKFLTDAAKLEKDAEAEVKKDLDSTEKFFEDKAKQGKQLFEAGKAEAAKDLKAAADFFEKERLALAYGLALAFSALDDKLEKLKAAIKAAAERLAQDAKLIGGATLLALAIELDAIRQTWLGGKVEQAIKAMESLLQRIVAFLKSMLERIKHLPAQVQEDMSNLAEDVRLAVEEFRQHAGQIVLTVQAHRERTKTIVGNLNDLLKQFTGRDATVTSSDYSKADHMEHAQTVDKDSAELLNEIEKVAETLGMLSQVDEIKFEAPAEKEQESDK